ncbi:MAG: hypothetical protein AB3N14_12575 [Flavobacteriaceae bacterium]
MSFRLRLVKARWSIFAFIVGFVGLLATVLNDVSLPSEIYTLDGWMDWIKSFKNIAALITATIAGIGAYMTIKQMNSPELATEETVLSIKEVLEEVKHEIIGNLDLIEGYQDLEQEYIKKLPTAIVIANYGITPFYDLYGNLEELLRWANSKNCPKEGRLFHAPAGRGKTRLGLELITILRSQGWKGGILPRKSLENDNSSSNGLRKKITRFFESRGEKGAILILDYAETRLHDVELLAEMALKASKGSPIRILLLARSANFWWRELHTESRHIQLFFDDKPMTQSDSAMTSAQRLKFFKSIAHVFAKKMADAKVGEEILDPLWYLKPIPVERFQKKDDISLLALSFEAYLYVRGVDSKYSVLVEMAREERRHWSRALGLSDFENKLLSDNRIEAVGRCVSVLTFLQGSLPESYKDTIKKLESIILTGLAKGPIIGTNEFERANSISLIKSVLEKLYLFNTNQGSQLIPVLPDLLGEYICALTLKNCPTILNEIKLLGNEEYISSLTITNRIGSKSHESKIQKLSIIALRGLIPNERDNILKKLVEIGRFEIGGIISALEQSVEILGDKKLMFLSALFPAKDPILGKLLGKITNEQILRHIETEDPRPFPGSIDYEVLDKDISRLEIPINEDIEFKRAMLLSNAATRSMDFRKASKWFQEIYDIYSNSNIELESKSTLLAYNRSNYISKALDFGIDLNYRHLIEQAYKYLDNIKKDSLPYLSLHLFIANATSRYFSSIGDYESAWSFCWNAIEIYQNSSEEIKRQCVELMIEQLGNALHFTIHLGDIEAAIIIGELSKNIVNEYYEDNVLEINSMSPFIVNIYNNLSLLYSEIGKKEEAMEISVMAVELSRELAIINPDEYNFDLGKSLDGLAVDHLAIGNYEVAIEMEEEAIELIRSQAIKNPTNNEDLAAALINQALGMIEVNDNENAVKNIIEAKKIYTELIEQNKVRFTHMIQLLKNCEVKLFR